jgi:hypothetical protein
VTLLPFIYINYSRNRIKEESIIPKRPLARALFAPGTTTARATVAAKLPDPAPSSG